jgi:hypothetical protein
MGRGDEFSMRKSGRPSVYTLSDRQRVVDRRRMNPPAEPQNAFMVFKRFIRSPRRYHTTIAL